MARDTSPIVKQSRREGYALHPKAHKIMARKSGIPGVHAHGRQGKPSLYLTQLREKQKLIPNKAYLCQNVERPYVDPVTQESKVGIDVQILTVLSPLELVDALKEVGAPVDMSVKAGVHVGQEDQESV
jgi:ribosomal protein S4